MLICQIPAFKNQPSYDRRFCTVLAFQHSTASVDTSEYTCFYIQRNRKLFLTVCNDIDDTGRVKHMLLCDLE